MNFNFLILLILLAVGCGVKGNPVEPEGSPNPSVLENYPDINLNQNSKEKKKF